MAAAAPVKVIKEFSDLWDLEDISKDFESKMFPISESKFPDLWNLEDITKDFDSKIFPFCYLTPDKIEKINGVAIKTISDISKWLPTKVEDEDPSAKNTKKIYALLKDAKDLISKEFPFSLTWLTDLGINIDLRKNIIDLRINIYVLGNFFRIAFENDNTYAMQKIISKLIVQYSYFEEQSFSINSFSMLFNKLAEKKNVDLIKAIIVYTSCKLPDCYEFMIKVFENFLTNQIHNKDLEMVLKIIKSPELLERIPVKILEKIFQDAVRWNNNEMVDFLLECDRFKEISEERIILTLEALDKLVPEKISKDNFEIFMSKLLNNERIKTLVEKTPFKSIIDACKNINDWKSKHSK